MSGKEKKLHVRCPQFGWGCDLLDEFCMACKDQDECYHICQVDKAKKDMGYKPKIPKAKDPNKQVAGISKPYISNLPFKVNNSLLSNSKKKVSFTVWLDLEWLKKQLGLNYFKDKNDEETKT